MCIPLPIISAATSVIGFGVQAIGAKQAGAAQRAQLAYQEGVARNNAIIAQQDIAAEKFRLEEARAAQVRLGKLDRGRIRVALAALGQVVDEPDSSAEGLVRDALIETTHAQRIAEYESALRQRNIQIAATNYTSSADLLNLRSKEQQRATSFQVATSALTTVGGFGRNFRFDSTQPTFLKRLQFRTS